MILCKRQYVYGHWTLNYNTNKNIYKKHIHLFINNRSSINKFLIIYFIADQEETKYGLANAAPNTGGARLCAQCGKVITERFLLKAMERFWHEDCLKCGCCDCRLGEVGSKLYYKADLMLCKRDYLRQVQLNIKAIFCSYLFLITLEIR